MQKEKPMYSIVIPVYNEEENIANLHQEIKGVCEKEKYNYEVIIIDDGSTDKTSSIAKKLFPSINIQLRRNFGQTAAIDCGIKKSQGEYIIILDGDGQNDPADIPNLINYLECNDLDVVSGWRRNRKDKLSKIMVSRIAKIMRNIIIRDGLNDSGCSLKIYRSECFEGITLFGEMHRFIPAVLKIKGFRIGELEVNHRPRVYGRTKYGWKRSMKGFIDMISVWFWYKYAVRPLHLLGGYGIFSIVLGIITAGVGLWFYVMGITLFRFFLPILSAFLLLSGIQVFLIGLIADMLSKNYFETSKNTPYSIRSTFENKSSNTK